MNAFPNQSALVDRLATMKNQKGIYSYWTQNGHVYVKGGEKSPRIHVAPERSEQTIKEKLTRQPTIYSEAAQWQLSERYAETAVKNSALADGADYQVSEVVKSMGGTTLSGVIHELVRR